MPRFAPPAPRRRLPLRALLLGLVVSLLVLAPAPEADAGIELPRTQYRDPVHKFSFKIFKDWKQVPVEAGEAIEVAKFSEGGSGRGGWVTPSLVVVRINKRDGGNTPTVTGDINEVMRRMMEARNPKSAWAATLGRVRLPEGTTFDESDFKKVKSKDKIEGKFYAFEYPYAMARGRDVPSIFVSLAVFEKDDIEYGLFFRSMEDRRKSYEKGLEKLAKTFRFFDEKAKDVQAIDVLEGVNITPERRREIERTMVKGWDVVVSPKKNYIVIYNTMRDKNHRLAKEIAKRIEMIREQIYEVQFPPAQPIDAVSIVRVCGNRKEYHEYGGPGGSAGYWNSGSEELVFYDASPGRKIDFDTVSVLYHEAFHQYIYYSAGNVAPHSWFNEGHGDYYAGADLKGRKFKIKPFRWRQGIIKNAVAKGPREKVEVEDKDGSTKLVYANDGGYTPLVDLVRFTQREYYRYPGVSYAQGWSLIYFLREVVPDNKKYEAKWGHILDVYFKTLKGEAVDAPADEEGDGARDAADDDADEDGDDGDADPDEGKTDGGTDDDDGGEKEEEDGESSDEAPAAWIPPPMFGGRGGREALKRAVDAAFDGIDFDELEAAWVKAVKKDM